jgi:hypothetical protein
VQGVQRKAHTQCMCAHLVNTHTAVNAHNTAQHNAPQRTTTQRHTGACRTLADLNPDGWHGPKTWKMFYGLGVSEVKWEVVCVCGGGASKPWGVSPARS